MGRVHDGAMNHHVVVDELSGTRAIGEDATDGASDEKYITRPVGRKPVRHLALIAKVDLVSARGENIGESLVLKMPHQCRSDESSVSSDIDGGVSIDHQGYFTVDSCARTAAINRVTKSLRKVAISAGYSVANGVDAG